jgi:hypothetical protein
MTLTAPAVRRRLRALAVPGNVAILRRFFKTGPGEYGEASPHAANRAALRDRAVSRVRAQAVPDRSGLNVELLHQLKDRSRVLDEVLGAITYSHLSATIGSTRVARRAGR